jgi:AcrR family transcriptional regulator
MEAPMPRTPRDTAIRPPRQARSERTLERILAAAESLASRRPFDEISVDDIVECAGTSVGAFYKRFPSKQALLPGVLARMQTRHLANLRTQLSTTAARRMPLAERVFVLLSRQADAYRAHRAMTRAIVAGRVGGGLVLPAAEADQARAMLGLLAEWLLERRTEMRRPDPEIAVRIALHFSISSLQLTLLQDEPSSVSAERLVAELSQAVVAYLTSPDVPLPAAGALP